MEDRRAEAAFERLVDPLGREPVGAERLVLDGELVPLLLVGGEAQAARAPGGVAGEPDEPLERAARSSASKPCGPRVRSSRWSRHTPRPPRVGRTRRSGRSRPQRPRARRGAAPPVRPRRARAHAQPVTPPPTTTTSGRPASRRAGIGGAGSSSPVARAQRSDFTFASGTKARLPASLIPLTVL